MKTLMIVSALVLLTEFAEAQKLKETDVPAAVKEGFKLAYPGIKAKEWEKEGDKYEAEFDLKKVETSATFTANGKLEETESEIVVTQLPKTVAEYVKKNYPGHKITEASKITETSTGKISYEAEIVKGKDEMDLVFDENGVFLQKEENHAPNDND